MKARNMSKNELVKISKEADKLVTKLIEIDGKSEDYRAYVIYLKAYERANRRYKLVLKRIDDLVEQTKKLDIAENKLMVNIEKAGLKNEVKKAGRPKLDNKKKAISIKLPPELIKWMDRQPEKRPELIETALNKFYNIEIDK